MESVLLCLIFLFFCILNVQDSPDVQKSALQVIINCVCAPIERKGGGGSSASGGGTPGGGTPGGPGRVLFGAASNLTNKSKKGSIKTSEDLIIRVSSILKSACSVGLFPTGSFSS